MAPTFNVEGGAYTTAQNIVIITPTVDAKIYYTVDGTLPTLSSNLYTGAVSISSSQTIKAIATKTGWKTSEVVTADYEVNLLNSQVCVYDSPSKTLACSEKTYKTTDIGTQVWMAENLNYETDSGSYCLREKATNCDSYGRLYTWSAATNGAKPSNNDPSGIKGVCPTGWHIPSDLEWDTLFDYVVDDAGLAEGGTNSWSEGAEKLKTTTGWQASEGVSSDDAYGFSAVPAGLSTQIGVYGNNGFTATWWSASRKSSNLSQVSYLIMHYNGNWITRAWDGKSDNARSVRCIMD